MTHGLLRTATHGRVGSMRMRRGSRPEHLQGRIALQGLGECHATLGAEVVVAEPAHTVKAG